MLNQADEILVKFRAALYGQSNMLLAQKLLDDYENSAGRNIKTQKAMELQLKRLGDTARETGARFKDLADRAEEITNLGKAIRDMGYALGQVGESFFNKQQQGINEYVRSFGNVESASARYNQSLKAIEASNTRIGRLGAQALIPQMEEQAATAERWASFLEKNSWLAGASANIGSVVEKATGAVAQAGMVAMGLGALASLPSDIEKAYKRLGEIGAGFGNMITEAMSGGGNQAQSAAAMNAQAATGMEDAANKNLAAATASESAASARGVGGALSDTEQMKQDYSRPFQGASNAPVSPASSSELVNSLNKTQAGNLVASETQVSAASTQTAAATAQTKNISAFGIGVAAMGGLMLGLNASSALAKSGINDSRIMKDLDKSVGDFTQKVTLAIPNAISKLMGGKGDMRLGFKFTDPSEAISKLIPVIGAALGSLQNGLEDITNSAKAGMAQLAVIMAKTFGDMFGGDLFGRGDQWAASMKATTSAAGMFTERTVDHSNDMFVALAELTGQLQSGSSAAQKSAEAWPQAVEAYAQYSKQNQEAQQSYNIEVSRANAENDRQAMLALDNFNHNKKRSEDEFYRQNMLADQQRQHQKDVEDAEIAHQRLQEDKQLGHTREMEDADRQHQISKQLEQFNYQESITESNYLKQRLLAARDFSIQMADAEYQYQKQAVRDLEDHDDRVLQLGKQNDAMGIVLEMRQYEKDRRRKAEDHNYDLSKSNEQFARQQADQEREFAYERQLRLDEMARNQDLEKKDIEYRRGVQDDDIKYQRGVQDKETQYKRDQADKEYDWDKRKRAEDFAHQQEISQQEFDREQGLTATQNALRLGEMKDQYEREKAKRSLQFEDQLNQLDGALLGETKQRDDYYKIMGDNLKTWLKDQTDMISGKGTGEYKAPTYVRPGDTSQINNPNVVFLPGVGVVPVGTTQTGSNKTRARAEGGYAKFGKYTLGEHGDEFVVKADATRQLERILGQRLTQEGLLAAVSTQRASGSYNAHMAQSFTFNGMPNSAQSQDLVNSIRQAISHDLAVSLKRAASRNI